MDTNKIREIGFWIVEILLVLGAIVSGILGKAEVASTCAIGAIVIYILES